MPACFIEDIMNVCLTFIILDFFESSNNLQTKNYTRCNTSAAMHRPAIYRAFALPHRQSMSNNVNPSFLRWCSLARSEARFVLQFSPRRHHRPDLLPLALYRSPHTTCIDLAIRVDFLYGKRGEFDSGCCYIYRCCFPDVVISLLCFSKQHAK